MKENSIDEIKQDISGIDRAIREIATRIQYIERAQDAQVRILDKIWKDIKKKEAKKNDNSII